MCSNKDNKSGPFVLPNSGPKLRPHIYISQLTLLSTMNSRSKALSIQGTYFLRIKLWLESDQLHNVELNYLSPTFPQGPPLLLAFVLFVSQDPFLAQLPSRGGPQGRTIQGALSRLAWRD